MNWRNVMINLFLSLRLWNTVETCLATYMTSLLSHIGKNELFFLCGHSEFQEKEEGWAKSVRFQAVQVGCLGSNLGYSLRPPSITKQDKALSNLVSPQIWLCFEQEVELESSWGLSSLRNPVFLWCYERR